MVEDVGWIDEALGVRVRFRDKGSGFKGLRLELG